MNGIKLYDIESFKNFFCVAIRDHISKEEYYFEISEVQNDIDKIYKWFKNFNGYLVAFNSLHYDDVMIKYLLDNYKSYVGKSYLDITLDLKTFSDRIIHSEDNQDELIKRYKYYKQSWITIDLFSYWSKGLRISKKLSLKGLAIQLGYDTIQELPYTPDTLLTIEDLPKLRHYCCVHDIGVLSLLLDNMKEEVKLRDYIHRQYKLPCYSWDAPKLSIELLLQDYCKITGKDVKKTRDLRFERPTLHFKDLFNDFNPDFQIPIFKDLWNYILSSTDTFGKEIIVNYGKTNIKLSYGIGGLHSVNENEVYYSDDNYQIVTSDFTSLYPNLIINYKCIRFPEVLKRYADIKDERVIAKKAGEKSKDSLFKLILNGTSGLLDNAHGFLYYPEGAMRLRLLGQLILTKCIETCLLNDWQVVSANTDGIEVIVPKHELDKYYKLLDETADLFDLKLEHEMYNRIYYKNVNNYITITEKGKIKKKGLFVDNPVLGNSTNELVIAKALEAYFIHNIQPEDFILNPTKNNLHIYDFCRSDKVAKIFTVLYNNQPQQQLNRYYSSKKGFYLFKQKDGANPQHLNKNSPIKLFNNYEEKSWLDYEIDFHYYIIKTRKVINELENKQLSLF